jgi:hypothetical protein
MIDLFVNDERTVQLEYKDSDYTQINLRSGSESKTIGFVSLENFHERMKTFDECTTLKLFEAGKHKNIFNAAEPHLSAYMLFDGTEVAEIKILDVDNKTVFGTLVNIVDVKVVCAKLEEIVTLHDS